MLNATRSALGDQTDLQLGRFGIHVAELDNATRLVGLNGAEDHLSFIPPLHTHIVFLFKVVGKEIGIVQLPAAGSALLAAEGKNEVTLRSIAKEFLQILGFHFINLPST